MDGDIYAQPLLLSLQGLNIAGKGRRNVVHVATMHNTVYAFDADSNTRDNGSPLWSAPFGGVVPIAEVQKYDKGIRKEVGILSTPVIDLSSNTLYVVSRAVDATRPVDPTSKVHYHQWLHALDIDNGKEKFGGPKEIKATYNGLTFNPKVQNQRASLLLLNGNVYIAWGAHDDTGDENNKYYGWVMGYSASTLEQTAVYVDTGSNGGSWGGIWQAGMGLTADTTGHIYLQTGNGGYPNNLNPKYPFPDGQYDGVNMWCRCSV